jgi:phosphoribosylaminoimidazole-succinocarboxamide synthase
MTVRPAVAIGKGLEVLCRYKAVGSFYRRYSDYIREAAPLDALVEMTIKNDEKGDPSITKETLAELGIMTNDEYDFCVAQTKKIAGIIRDDMAKKGLELYDIKMEYGKVNGKITLMDDISAGCMRVYKDNTAVAPMELNKLMGV